MSAQTDDASPWWFLYSPRIDLTDDERATYARVHSHALGVDDLARRRDCPVRDVEHELAAAEAKVEAATGEVVPA